MSEVHVERFAAFGDLQPEDRRLLDGLSRSAVRLRAGCDVRAAWEGRHVLFLLREGWVASSTDLPDGARQIVKLHLPGDFMGAPSLAFHDPVETLTTLTPAWVSPLSLPALGDLFTRAPRLAAMLFLGAQEERAVLMDRLTAVGRMDAEHSVASLLLHLHDRLAPAHPSGVLPFPLTQAHVADALGLTSVHVSRIMRRLERAGRVRRAGRTLEILDLDGLRDEAVLPQRRLRRDADWLPGHA